MIKRCQTFLGLILILFWIGLFFFSALNVKAQTKSLTYQQMSESEQKDFIKVKTNKILDRFGRVAGDEISPAGLDRIKSFLDGYVKRIAIPRKLNRPFGDNLKDVLERGNKVSPFIVEAMAKKGLLPEVGIYVAMIETEFHSCLQAPTGPLGLFQFTYAMAQQYFDTPANIIKGATSAKPDDRCKALEAAKGYAAYMKNLSDNPRFDMFTNDAIGIPLLIASFNSGEGGLRINFQKVKEITGKEKVGFWDMLANGDQLSKQFQSENSKYVPQFFAAAIIGENPQDFEINDFQPLSTVKTSNSIVTDTKSVNPSPKTALDVPVAFWQAQKELAMAPRNQPTGEFAPGLMNFPELSEVSKQKELLDKLKSEKLKPPMDFFELAEKNLSGELVELPMATDTYFLDVGGNATEGEITVFSFKNGSVIPSINSPNYQNLKKLADDFSGQKYDLNNPRDRKQIKIRLLRMLQPKARAVLEEIANQYKQKFQRPLRVTSLIRSIEYQIGLNVNNANSFKVTEDAIPPHCIGLAFDLALKQMTAEEQNFIQNILVMMEKQGKIDGNREIVANASFHIFVF